MVFCRKRSTGGRGRGVHGWPSEVGIVLARSGLVGGWKNNSEEARVQNVNRTGYRKINATEKVG